MPTPVSDDPFAPKGTPVSGDPFAPAAPPPSPGNSPDLGGVGAWWGETQKAAGAANTAYRKDAPEALKVLSETVQHPIKTVESNLTDPSAWVGRTQKLAAPVMDAMAWALSPASAASTEYLGKPIASGAKAMGLPVKPETAGDWASMALPIVGESAMERKLAEEAAKMGFSPEAWKSIVKAKPSPVAPKEDGLFSNEKHAQAVNLLQQRGVNLTRGYVAGGHDKAIQEALKSHPLTREGIVQAERQSFESMNRAAYNDVLKELGMSYKDRAVGYDGIAKLHDIFDAGYESVKPGLVAQNDEQLQGDIASISRVIPKAQQADFDRIVEDVVNSKFSSPDGAVRADAAKNIQSELSHYAAIYKHSSVASEKLVGEALDDVNEAVGSSFERHSDPSIIPQLRALNKGYAKYKVLESAAANRTTSHGLFSGADMLAAIKRNPYGSKGSFAQGRGLMQDFASAAHRVMGNEVPDSGTAFRLATLARMGAGAGAGAMIGHVPGALAGMAVEPAAGALALRYAKSAPKLAKAAKARTLGKRIAPAVALAVPTAASVAQSLAGSQNDILRQAIDQQPTQ